ncbi:Uncharacterized protein APZ42_004565, partial [Daphnia magna]
LQSPIHDIGSQNSNTFENDYQSTSTSTELSIAAARPVYAVRTRVSKTFPVTECTRLADRADLRSTNHTTTAASSLSGTRFIGIDEENGFDNKKPGN